MVGDTLYIFLLMKDLQVVKVYEGNAISFSKGKNVMVNATEMAKPFGKRVSDWLSNQNTKEFIDTLTETRKSVSADFQAVIVVRGGNPDAQGTWLHEDAALEFARWLSPKFAIWCNDRIKELLTTGSTSLPKFDVPQTFSDALMLAAKQQKQIEEQQKAIELKDSTISSQQKTIEEQKPSVTFTNAVSGSQSACLIGELAKLICQNGVKIGQEYIEQGLFVIKKGVRTGNDGVLYTTKTPKVTGKGQVYFINKFLNDVHA
jgi:phage antirepressor YoqD-like protein